MTAEQDPDGGRSGSSSRDLGDTPDWEAAPARTSPREDAPATDPIEPPPSADQAEMSAAEARSIARRESRSRGGQEGRRGADSPNMLPRRQGRPLLERLLVRVIATCGIVAIGVAIAAIMVSSNSDGWLIGLVVSVVSVVLAAILWSSRTL